MPRGILPHAVRPSLGGVVLVLVVLVLVLMSPILGSSAPDLRRPPEGLHRNLALPASDPSRLSAMAWIMHEDAAVAVRSEDDDDDDDEPSGATREAYGTYDPSLAPTRSAPARELAAPGRLAATRRLRC